MVVSTQHEFESSFFPGELNVTQQCLLSQNWESESVLSRERETETEERRVLSDTVLWASLVTSLCLPVFRRKSGLQKKEEKKRSPTELCVCVYLCIREPGFSCTVTHWHCTIIIPSLKLVIPSWIFGRLLWGFLCEWKSVYVRYWSLTNPWRLQRKVP